MAEESYNLLGYPEKRILGHLAKHDKKSVHILNRNTKSLKNNTK